MFTFSNVIIIVCNLMKITKELILDRCIHILNNLLFTVSLLMKYIYI